MAGLGVVAGSTAGRVPPADDDDVRFRRGNVPHGGDRPWFASARSAAAACREFQKISILEVQGYCYGWHFYQAADADLVISSDDALFGHAAFRYAGWGPGCGPGRDDGARKFKEMVFTGRPFTAEEMYDCNFVNKVVPRDQLEAEDASTPLPARARGRPTRCISRRCSSRCSSSSRASSWARCWQDCWSRSGATPARTGPS